MYPRINSICLWAIMAIGLSGCAGYQKSMRQYNKLLDTERYDKAYSNLPDYKFLQNNRNRFLFYAERGRLAQLMNQHDSSNYYLNLADAALENSWKNAGGTIRANLINPLQQRYIAGDLERMMLHYTKGINYLTNSDWESAAVEARRITLAANRLKDEREKGTTYALSFGYWMQGVMYEATGDINNAFIAYRNAVNEYMDEKSNGLATLRKDLPDGFLEDVMRTATKMGFTDQSARYASFGGSSGKAYKPDLTKQPEGGMLLILHETGLAPRLENSFFSFNSLAPGSNDLYFADRGNQYNLPVQLSSFSGFAGTVSPTWFKGLRVAMATPVQVSNTSVQATVNANGMQHPFSLVQDSYAWHTQPEKMRGELKEAIIRALVKKGGELAIQEGTRAIATTALSKDDNSKGSNNDNSDKLKDAATAAAIAQGAGLLINLLNQSTEVADTRSWRSLPGAIYAVRVPLQPGNNEITIQSGGKISTLHVQGNGGLQVIKW